MNAIKEGTVTITAKAGQKQASCVVTVAKKVIAVESVELNKTSLELIEGDSETLVATIKPDDATDKTVTWTTSNSSIATVDNGKVNAIKEGTVTITAKAGQKQASCVVTVTKKVIAIESVELNKTSLELIEGDSETLVATVKPDNATDKTVTWSTSNSSIATVDNGKVNAIKEGTATITAKAGQKQASCVVTVAKKVVGVSSVELNKTSVSLKVGETVTLTATVKPDDATDKTVIWTTSDASVATVDNGVVTAVKVGTSSITVKAGDKEASCLVTVDDGKINGFDYVDLGLPSGIKWATCNVGANNPEEWGDSYSWGEVEIYTGDVNKYYRYETETDSSGFKHTYQGYVKYITKSGAEKYGFKGFYDDKTVLDLEDDVAHVILGGTWRMPTKEELDELLNTNHCSWEFVTYKNVDGYKVTSKIDGYTNNWIFLPCGFWTSSLDLFWQDYAVTLATYIYYPYSNVVDRMGCLSIRAVSK